MVHIRRFINAGSPCQLYKYIGLTYIPTFCENPFIGEWGLYNRVTYRPKNIVTQNITRYDDHAMNPVNDSWKHQTLQGNMAQQHVCTLTNLLLMLSKYWDTTKCCHTEVETKLIGASEMPPLKRNTSICPKIASII